MIKKIIASLIVALGVGVSGAYAQCTPSNTHPPTTALDHDSMLAAYTASFVGIFHRPPSMVRGSGYDDGEYWISVSDHFGEFGDGICRAGWNAYWEQKLACQCDSADPSLGDQKARFQPVVVTPVPPPPPPPVEAPKCASPEQVEGILGAVKGVESKVDAGNAEQSEFFRDARHEYGKFLKFVAKYGTIIASALGVGKYFLQ